MNRCGGFERIPVGPENGPYPQPIKIQSTIIITSLQYHRTMGKQSKRNKRRSSSKKKHNPTGLAADPGLVSATINNTEENESPTLKIIQKIRHGDPR